MENYSVVNHHSVHFIKLNMIIFFSSRLAALIHFSFDEETK